MIIPVEGKANYNESVDIITREANSTARYGPYGAAFSVKGYVVGFYGRAGALLDAIGVYYLPPVQKSPEFGGSGGTVFTDPVETNMIPPIVGIRQIRACADDSHITSIDTDYYLLGGGTYPGEAHGGDGKCQIFEFDAEEEITTFTGAHDTLVDFLFFSTDVQHTVGPLGPWPTRVFEERENKVFGLRGNIIGFFGHSSIHLDSIGVFCV